MNRKVNFPIIFGLLALITSNITVADVFCPQFVYCTKADYNSCFVPFDPYFIMSNNFNGNDPQVGQGMHPFADAGGSISSDSQATCTYNGGPLTLNATSVATDLRIDQDSNDWRTNTPGIATCQENNSLSCPYTNIE